MKQEIEQISYGMSLLHSLENCKKGASGQSEKEVSMEKVIVND